MKVLGKNVLVEKLAEEKKSAIILSTEEVYFKAKVIEVASKVEDVKKDDIVLISKFGNIEVKFEGKDYLILEDKNIILVY